MTWHTVVLQGELSTKCYLLTAIYLYLSAPARLVHSHWSRSVEALLWLVEIMVPWAAFRQDSWHSKTSDLISDIDWTSLLWEIKDSEPGATWSVWSCRQTSLQSQTGELVEPSLHQTSTATSPVQSSCGLQYQLRPPVKTRSVGGWTKSVWRNFFLNILTLGPD